MREFVVISFCRLFCFACNARGTIKRVVNVIGIVMQSRRESQQIQYVVFESGEQEPADCTNGVILKELRSLQNKMYQQEEHSKKILTKLTEEIISLRNEIKNFKSNHLPNGTISYLPTLPLSSLDNLQEFDSLLLSNDEMRTELKHVLARIGADDVPTFLRRAIKAIITDELAVNLTWRGTALKPSIQQFTVFSIIKDTCFLKHPHATDLHINKTCQQHFLHARDRVARKHKPPIGTTLNELPFEYYDN